MSDGKPLAALLSECDEYLSQMSRDYEMVSPEKRPLQGTDHLFNRKEDEEDYEFLAAASLMQSSTVSGQPRPQQERDFEMFLEADKGKSPDGDVEDEEEAPGDLLGEYLS